MPAKVVDASALAAVLFAEPEAEQVCAHLGDAVLVAPPLIEYELGNTCLKKLRRQPDQAAALCNAFRALGALNLQLHDVDRMAVLELARAKDLSFYDASYLWLARDLNLQLVSLDQKLMAART